MDEGSSRRKHRPRGKSLINFTACFGLPSLGDHGGKILASDDNLVYCHDTGNDNGVHGDHISKTKLSSSHGHIPRKSKAILFHTAMKKEIHAKKTSENTIESTTESSTELNTEPLTTLNTESSIQDEKANTNSDDHEVVTTLETENNSSNDNSSVVSLTSETEASLAAVNDNQNVVTTIDTNNISPIDDSSIVTLSPKTNASSVSLNDNENLVTTLDADNDSLNSSSNVASSSPKTKPSNDNDNVVTTLDHVDNDSLNNSSSEASLSPKTKPSNDKQNLVTTLETSNNSSNDISSAVSMVASSGVDVGSQVLTERKVLSRVNSKKKPPLPSGPRSTVKIIPEQNNDPATLDDLLCLFIVVLAFVSAVLWMSFTSNVT